MVGVFLGSNVVVNKNGCFMITWENTNDTLANTYAQLYSSNGTPIGNNFRVNNNLDEGGFPSIYSDVNGNFIIT